MESKSRKDEPDGNGRIRYVSQVDLIDSIAESRRIWNCWLETGKVGIELNLVVFMFHLSSTLFSTFMIVEYPVNDNSINHLFIHSDFIKLLTL